jgi:hypothetical protein
MTRTAANAPIPAIAEAERRRVTGIALRRDCDAAGATGVIAKEIRDWPHRSHQYARSSSVAPQPAHTGPNDPGEGVCLGGLGVAEAGSGWCSAACCPAVAPLDNRHSPHHPAFAGITAPHRGQPWGLRISAILIAASSQDTRIVCASFG